MDSILAYGILKKINPRKWNIIQNELNHSDKLHKNIKQIRATPKTHQKSNSYIVRILTSLINSLLRDTEKMTKVRLL